MSGKRRPVGLLSSIFLEAIKFLRNIWGERQWAGMLEMNIDEKLL